MDSAFISEFLSCPACRVGALTVGACEMDGAEIRNGVVTCADCATWYRLESGLLELLVPALRSPTVDAAFCQRLGFTPAGSATDGNGAASAGWESRDDHKLGQKQFYDEDAASYETNLMRLPFWQAFDRNYIAAIRPMGGPRGVMVEVGGGSGRLSVPLRHDFGTIVSFDISEAMVRRAMRRLSEAGGAPTVRYLVADAENIPVKSGCTDVVVFSGILHHVAAPGQVILEAARILVPGGRFVGMENNQSVFRPLFDMLMRWRRLWNEKAHPEHFTISARDLRDWFAAAGVEGRVWTSVFLPPHAFNLLSVRAAQGLLTLTDRVMSGIPWLGRQGGLILFSGRRPPASQLIG